MIRVNVLGMLNLADLCEQRNIHLTTYATGCIFHYDDNFPQGSGKGFKEEDTPNFHGSYYSKTKVAVDSTVQHFQAFFFKSGVIPDLCTVHLGKACTLLFSTGYFAGYGGGLAERVP